ncbi:MAG: serine protease, partial [Pseudomonadota bacterium]
MNRATTMLFVGLLWLWAPVAWAQQVWLQIEALPTLAEAQTRAQAYTRSFQNVSGFQLRSGWYAIALGPYSRATANQELVTLRSRRLIPRDSFIALSEQYRQQFWPSGAQAAPQPDTTALAAQEPPAFLPTDETLREARSSESLLTRDERLNLQEALQWFGFYSGGIDGAFGRGTRAAMEVWQISKGFEPTGVLTTNQRLTLLNEFQEVFASLGLRVVRDDPAGIEMLIPAGMVERDREETPFVHYDSRTDDGVKLVLISQRGDQRTLFGLYDIMQTLEIVPTDGERNRARNSFTLTGQNDKLHSYTYAVLNGDAVKGFTLTWKPEDARLMNRVVTDMKESFTALPGQVLPEVTGDGSEQRIDLVSGLSIRKPERSRSGFFVNADGAVLTTTDVLDGCGYVTIERDTRASLVARDETLGVALVAPETPLAPAAFAAFQSSIPRLRSDIAVSGYPYEGVLEQPTLTFGLLADIRGLSGEETVQRLEVKTLAGDAGGPVLDETGAVIGMLQAAQTDGSRALPEDVQFATNVASLAEFLVNAGINPAASSSTQALEPVDLTTKANKLTV